MACKKICHQEAFLKAIAIEEKSIVDQIDIAGMCTLINQSINQSIKPAAIEDSYAGPSLEKRKVTKEFMTELIAFYKQQKSLHKKYAFQVCYLLTD